MVVQVLMRGRGGTTRARARGIGERRTGGETECIQRWGEGVKLVQVVTMVGAGGVGGSGKEQESRAEEVAGHNQYRKVVGPCIIHVSTQSFFKIFLVVVLRSSRCERRWQVVVSVSQGSHIQWVNIPEAASWSDLAKAVVQSRRFVNS